MVVASVADVAASGGYYIAMGCERIVCDDLSITGSIGVVSAVLKIGELLEKVCSAACLPLWGGLFLCSFFFCGRRDVCLLGAVR